MTCKYYSDSLLPLSNSAVLQVPLEDEDDIEAALLRCFVLGIIVDFWDI